MTSRRLRWVFFGFGLSMAQVWACSSGGNSPTSASTSSGSGGSTASSTQAASSTTAVSSVVATGAGGGGTGNLGLQCLSDSDCGSSLKCITASDNDPVFGGGPANGYCSKTCTSDNGCPGANSHCLMGSTGNTGLCVLGCTIGPGLMAVNDPFSKDNKCNERDDLVCYPINQTGTLDGCLPSCGSDSQCPTGRKCDPVAGVCVDMPNTGDPIGTQCDPTAMPSACAGRCISFEGPDGGTEATACSPICVLGGDANYLQTPSCGGLTNGICIFAPATSDPNTSNGAGDYGFCAAACTKQDDCQLPNFWCLPILNLTGTGPNTVPNGYCLGTTACPNGDSDCTPQKGTSCTQTAYGPQCLATNFPLGSATPDGGAGTGGSGTGGSGTGGGGTGGSTASSSVSGTGGSTASSSSSATSSSSTSTGGSGTGGAATDAGADSGDGG